MSLEWFVLTVINDYYYYFYVQYEICKCLHPVVLKMNGLKRAMAESNHQCVHNEFVLDFVKLPPQCRTDSMLVTINGIFNDFLVHVYHFHDIVSNTS